MKLLDYPKMVFSVGGGQDALRKLHPSVVEVFFRIVLPFSLVPALMILLAGHWYGDYYAPKVAAVRWYEVAVLFFVVELMTVPLMASVIHSIATDKVPDVDYHDSYLVAALAPVPLWLSALGLFVPNMLFNVLVAVFGLTVSSFVLFRGVVRILGVKEDVEAQDISYKAFAIGVVTWAMLIAFVVLPLMAG